MGMAQLATPLLVSMRARVHSLKPTYRKLGMVVQACNARAMEVTQSFPAFLCHCCHLLSWVFRDVWI